MAMTQEQTVPLYQGPGLPFPPADAPFQAPRTSQQQTGPRTVQLVTQTPAPQEPVCLICCEADRNLIKACRSCPAGYCRDCLTEMFNNATAKEPAKCCSIIQLYSVLPDYPSESAEAYRTKFKEWLTKDKLYCPVPTCSAFIHEESIPAPFSPSADRTLADVIEHILLRLHASESSRFSRGDHNDLRHISQYNKKVTTPMDLDIIQEKVRCLAYNTMDEVTDDIALIVTNTRSLVSCSKHPVNKAVDALQECYMRLLAEAYAQLIDRDKHTTPAVFPCPTCHIAICNRGCKQVEHGKSPCDSTYDQENAMLAKFGYKRCPRCREGTRRMFGCPHMQCPTCGAHWCWYCARSIDDCLGECGPGDGAYDANLNDGYEDDEHESEISDDDMADDDMGSHAQSMAHGSHALERGIASNQMPNSPARPRNLDSGGNDRWEGATEDFGDEPEDIPENPHEYGDFDYLECNRCFVHVDPASTDLETTAFDCSRCRLIVCGGCKLRYEAENESERAP